MLALVTNVLAFAGNEIQAYKELNSENQTINVNFVHNFVMFPEQNLFCHFAINCTIICIVAVVCFC